MKVTLRASGEIVRLAGSAELTADIEKWSATYACDHQERQRRRFPTSNGGFQTREQCNTCGHVLGGALKREPRDADLPLIDRDLQASYERVRQAAYSDVLQRHAQLQRDHETNWAREHDEYLKSPEWHAKRRLVFRRAQGLCEGCGIRPASQVHHRTYDHWREEFLFELLALCDECHGRLHTPEVEDDDSASVDDYEGWPSFGGTCAGCRFGSTEDAECFLTGETKVFELSDQGSCGPTKQNFQELK